MKDNFLKKIKRNQVPPEHEVPENYFSDLEGQVMRRWNREKATESVIQWRWVGIAASVALVALFIWMPFPNPPSDSMFVQLESEWEYDLLLDEMSEEEMDQLVEEMEVEIYDFATSDDFEDLLTTESMKELYESIIE